MSPEEILKNNPQFISRKQQEFYFDNGYLLIENAIDSQTLHKLQDITARAIDDSRQDSFRSDWARHQIPSLKT